MNAICDVPDRWRVAPREIEDNETIISIVKNEGVENWENDMLVFVNAEPVDVWYEQ